jgi:glycosyltransferase involved in cell wall biosynthesis
LPPRYNGCGDATDRLAREFQRRGDDALVLTDDTRDSNYPYPVTSVGSWNSRAVAMTKKTIDRFRPDIVLMQYTPFLHDPRSMYPLLAQRALRRHRRITYVHECFYGVGNVSVRSGTKAVYLQLRDRLVLAASESIYVASAQRAQVIADKAPGAASKVRVVPFGANVEPEAQLQPRRAPVAPYRLLSFGIVMPRRRIDLLIEAVAALKAFGVEAELEVAGRIQEPAYRRECERTAAERGVAHAVRFCGPVSPQELALKFAQADVLLHAAEEGAIASAGSLLAGLAHGVPVLCARTEGDDTRFADAVRFAEANPRAIAVELRDVLRNPVSLRDLGERSREIYDREFGWRRMADRIEADARVVVPAYAAL